MGKKNRAESSRICRSTERLTAEIISKFKSNHLLDDEGVPVAPVISNYIQDKCTDFRIFHNPHTNKREQRGGDKLKRHPIDAILNADKDFSYSEAHIPLPQRWNDTSQVLKRYMYLDALRFTNTPHRPICFWISQELILEAISRKENLAAWMHKRISARLTRLFGDTEFGLWFHLEHIPGQSDKVHAHGLIFVDDESWFKPRSIRYTHLRRHIREATGFNSDIHTGDIDKERWVHTPGKRLNHGYVDYCVKSRRERTAHPRFNITKLMPHYVGVPSAEIGHRLEAVSASLTRRAKHFYQGVLPTVRGFMTGDVLHWDDNQWIAAGAAMTDGLDMLL